MKTLIRFSTVKIRFLFHPFTSRKSLYVWHKWCYQPLIMLPTACSFKIPCGIQSNWRINVQSFYCNVYILLLPFTQLKTNNLFGPDENRLEQCFAANIVLYVVDYIVSIVELELACNQVKQCWTTLLTTVNSVGSKTLFNALFFRPEQVVRLFLLCIVLTCITADMSTMVISMFLELFGLGRHLCVCCHLLSNGNRLPSM